MGRTVEELSATMSVDELEDWQAYYSVEPWGSPVADDRTRHVLSMLYSAYGGKDDVVWLDRDPEWTAELSRRVAPDLDDKLEAYFEARLDDDPAT